MEKSKGRLKGERWREVEDAIVREGFLDKNNTEQGGLKEMWYKPC